jgi:hypothetical protein
MAAVLMMTAQTQPNARMTREFTRFPITLRSLVNRTTMTTRGGARRPFRTADQNSIFHRIESGEIK